MQNKFQNGLIILILSSMFGWGLVVISSVNLGYIQARSLPTYDDTEQPIDDRIGEKNIESTRDRVEERYDRENKTKQGQLGDVHSGDENPQGFLSELGSLKNKYHQEIDRQTDSTTNTSYFDVAYNEMLVEHREKLNAITDVQKDTNDLLQEIDDKLEEYVTTLFMASY